MILGNSELSVLAVKEGLGVAFISRLVIDKFGQQSTTPVLLDDLNLEREIFFARHVQRPAAAARKEFWEFIHHGHTTAKQAAKSYAD